MKITLKLTCLTLLSAILFACGGSEKEQKQQIKIGEQPKKETPKVTQSTNSADMMDLSNKGIGSIKSVTIGEGIDETMAARGEVVFGNMCTACHKMDKKFVGPNLADVTKRRAPEWIMNMIMNPDIMIKEDPIAKQLLIEANMAMMANQNVSEEDARSILEYLRKHDSK